MKLIYFIIDIYMMNFLSLDLNLLRVLNALIIERSTVRAGARVGLSQPAVSAALGRLRHALGDQLFLRRGQGLEPTAYTLEIAEPLQSTLERLEAVLQAPRQFDPNTSTATFKLSGSDYFAELLMPALAAALAERAPHMRAQLVNLVPDGYAETLERYEVDLALIPDLEPPRWAEKKRVFRSDFAVVARNGHPRLAQGRVAPGAEIPLDLFCDLGHILFSPEGKLKGMGDAALAEVGRERRVVMTLPAFSGVCRAVSGSDLIALVPRALATFLAPRMGLVVYEAPVPVPTVPLVMIWHRRSTEAPAHRWFRALVAELLAPLDVGVAAAQISRP